MKGPKWTDAEISYLRENYGPKSAEEIGEALGRTKQGVHTMRKRLGLRMTREQVSRQICLTRADQTGERNPAWKGGISRDTQRYTYIFRTRHREKHLAHCKVRHAIRRGKLTKQPCSVCGDPKSESHHEDYSKPLEVIWLCRTHHIQADKARRARESSSN